MKTLSISLSVVLLSFMSIGLNLAMSSNGDSKGYIRFIIRKVDKLSIFKEWLGFEPRYEGCFVYRQNYTGVVKIIRFNTNRSNYLELMQPFLQGTKTKVFYTKRLFGKAFIFKCEV